MSLLAGLSQQGDSISAHNADAGAHGIDSFSGAPLDIARAICLSGHDVASSRKYIARIWPQGVGATTQNSGLHYALGKTSKDYPVWYLINSQTSATGGGRTGTGAAVSGFARLASCRWVYQRAIVYFSNVSASAEEWNFRLGLDGNAFALPANFVGFVVDRGNVLGSLNASNSANFLAVCRSGSVNSVVDTGVAVATTERSAHLLEMVATSTAVNFYINAVLVASITTNIPTTSLLLEQLCWTKSNGTTARNCQYTSLSTVVCSQSALANCIICDGDSLTYGSNATDVAATSYPGVLERTLTASNVWNIGTPGEKITDNAGARALAKIATRAVEAGSQVVTVCLGEGCNDIATKTAEEITAALAAYTAAILAAVPTAKICLLTITTQTGWAGATETKRLAVNSWITASGHAVADLAADVRLQNPADLTYYAADGVHRTDAGYAVVAGIVQAALATVGVS